MLAVEKSDTVLSVILMIILIAWLYFVVRNDARTSRSIHHRKMSEEADRRRQTRNHQARPFQGLGSSSPVHRDPGPNARKE